MADCNIAEDIIFEDEGEQILAPMGPFVPIVNMNEEFIEAEYGDMIKQFIYELDMSDDSEEEQ